MRVLVIFGHLNIFHEMTAEIEVKCMAVLYLSPDMYLFYKTTNHYRLQYSSTNGNHLSLQNTKLTDFILLRNLYHTFLLCSFPVLLCVGAWKPVYFCKGLFSLYIYCHILWQAQLCCLFDCCVYCLSCSKLL